MNWAKLLALPRCHPGIGRQENGNDQERRIEARICGDGPREAARNCEQGRQGQPWRRPQEQCQPLNSSPACEKVAGRTPSARRFFASSERSRNAKAEMALVGLWPTARTSILGT